MKRLPGLDQYDRANIDDWHSDPSGHKVRPSYYGSKTENLPRLGDGAFHEGPWPARQPPRVPALGHRCIKQTEEDPLTGEPETGTCLICGH